MKQSLSELATLRAIACLGVLSMHVATEWGPQASWLEVALNQAVRFATPALLFVSSFLLAWKFRGSRPLARPFFVDRVKYLLIPYLALSAYYLYPTFVAGRLHEVLTQLLIGPGIHLYFIPLIFQFYGLFYLLSRRGLHQDPRLWRKALLPALAVSLCCSLLCIGFGLPMYLWQWLVPVWLPFFVLGGMFATDRHWIVTRWQKLGGWKHLLLASMVALITAQAIWLPHLPVGFDRLVALTSSRSPLVIMYGLLFITWFMCEPVFQRSPGKLVWLVSSQSFGIYLIHHLVYSEVAKWVPTLKGLPPALRFGVVLVACMGLVAILHHLPLGRLIVGKPGPKGPSGPQLPPTGNRDAEKSVRTA